MPGSSFDGPLQPETEGQQRLASRLAADVAALAARGVDRAAYVERRLADLGFDVARQEFEAGVNLEVQVPGAVRPDEIVVVGAHHDAVPDCPAADDNGSGVAGLLALAEVFRGERPDRTLRLVAFASEEPPWFQGESMGSLVYARARGAGVVAMISLESIGYYDDSEGSQRYPFPFGLLYPDRGNFVAFVGNSSSCGLVRRVVRTFRDDASFPSEGAALPGSIPGIGWSDHWSFWQIGVPALMVTDTAPFRNPHYHTSHDTPDTLDYDRMARVVEGLGPVVHDLLQAD